MAKFKGTDFNFGFNVKPKKPKAAKKPKAKRKTTGPRMWRGQSFGS